MEVGFLEVKLPILPPKLRAVPVGVMCFFIVWTTEEAVIIPIFKNPACWESPPNKDFYTQHKLPVASQASQAYYFFF